MKKILIVLLLSLISCNNELDALLFQQFQKFIKKYQKKYESVNEFLARFEVFKRNTLDDFSNDEKTYKAGITKFSDLTKQEFTKIYLNLNYDAMAMSNFNPTYVKTKNSAPDSFSWRDEGVVSPVKDQGSCGACWAFSVIGNLEGLYAIHYKKLSTFSEQMLVDCDTLDSGCNGGLMEYAFTWLQNYGIISDSDYPYIGRKGVCRLDPSRFEHMKIIGFKKLPSPADEDEVKEFLYETAPLSIALNANALQTYSSGVIDKTSAQCPPSGINHAALLVGYGNDSKSKLDYWLVKNSWGKSWGESGYFRIRRGNGTCGINSYVVTAIVEFDDIKK